MQSPPTTTGTHRPGRERSSSSHSSSSSASSPASSPVRGLDSAVTDHEVALTGDMTHPADTRRVSAGVTLGTQRVQATTPVCIAAESLDAYFGATRVVHGVSFGVRTGEVTAI